MQQPDADREGHLEVPGEVIAVDVRAARGVAMRDQHAEVFNLQTCQVHQTA